MRDIFQNRKVGIVFKICLGLLVVDFTSRMFVKAPATSPQAKEQSLQGDSVQAKGNTGTQANVAIDEETGEKIQIKKTKQNGDGDDGKFHAENIGGLGVDFVRRFFSCESACGIVHRMRLWQNIQ